MLSHLRNLTALFVLLIGGLSTSWAFTLSGTISGGGSPMAGALLSLNEATSGNSVGTVTTLTDGKYTFTVDAGTYNLIVSPPAGSGFASAPVNGFVVASADVRQDVALLTKLSESKEMSKKSFGVTAFKRGKYEVAFSELSNLQGKDAEAQYYLGQMYESGLGTTKNTQAAIRWYLRAADQGYPQAQFALGKLFGNGVDLPKNYLEAASWFERAARQGHNDAQLRLGLMYSNGSGKKQGRSEALAWIELAADGGNKDAFATRKKLLVQTSPADRVQAAALKTQLKNELAKLAK